MQKKTTSLRGYYAAMVLAWTCAGAIMLYKIMGHGNDMTQQEVALKAAPVRLKAQITKKDSRRYRINVFTYDRLASLRRLLDHLLAADYCDRQVSLYIFVDSGGPAEVREAVSEFKWPYGTYEPTIHQVHQGLAHNIVNSWQAMDETEVCFMFEDDVGVSPLFFRWALQLLRWGVNANNDKIVGISLNTHRLNQFMNKTMYTSGTHGSRLVYKDPEAWYKIRQDHITRPCGKVVGWTCWGHVFNYAPLRAKGQSVLRMQVPTSWGQMFLPGAWRKFREYYHAREFSALKSDVTALDIPWSMSNLWPIDTSWKRAMTEFMLANAMWMAYPMLPGEKSFSTTYREAGVHTEDMGHQAALRKDHLWEFTVPLLGASEALPGTSGKVSESPLVDIFGRSTSEKELADAGCEYRRQMSTSVDVGLSRAIAQRSLKCNDPTGPPSADSEISDAKAIIDAAITLHPAQLGSAPFRIAMQNYFALEPRVKLWVFADDDTCKIFIDKFNRTCLFIPPGSDPNAGHLPEVSAILRLLREHGSAPVLLFAAADDLFNEELVRQAHALLRAQEAGMLSHFVAVSSRLNVPAGFSLHGSPVAKEKLTQIDTVEEIRRSISRQWCGVLQKDDPQFMEFKHFISKSPVRLFNFLQQLGVHHVGKVTAESHSTKKAKAGWVIYNQVLLNTTYIKFHDAMRLMYRHYKWFNPTHGRPKAGMTNPTLQPPLGTDVILMDRGCPIVDDMPPFLVAMPVWDNWAMIYAAQRGWLVDATDTWAVIHPEHEETGREAFNEKVEQRVPAGLVVNRLLGGVHSRRGDIRIANFKTVEQSVHIKPRIREQTVKSYLNDLKQVDDIFFEYEQSLNFTAGAWHVYRHKETLNVDISNEILSAKIASACKRIGYQLTLTETTNLSLSCTLPVIDYNSVPFHQDYHSRLTSGEKMC